jgi:hypothetical protein
MNTPRRCLLALPVLSLSLIANPASASFSSPTDTQASANGASSQTYDQIVRLSLVEGDVRISRGKEGERTTGSEWGQAVANLPIASGFSLVTGTGRAEIELEDASTIYLGDNSVLTRFIAAFVDGFGPSDAGLADAPVQPQRNSAN